MTDQRWTYQVPDGATFVYNLQQYFKGKGNTDLVEMLTGAKCRVFHWSSYVGNDQYATTVALSLRPTHVGKVDEFEYHLLKEAAELLMPPDSGLLITDLVVGSLLDPPPADESKPLNQAHFITGTENHHDGLRFRSKTETKIYDALRKRNVLFFPLPAAIFGGKDKDYKREPDFLVCHEGKWGLLEVMGDNWHTNATAVRDHERGRLFNDHGITCIHFYGADDCYNKADWVIEDFLKRLAKS